MASADVLLPLRTDKPFGDVRRVRHEGARRRDLHGHTARKSCTCTTCRKARGTGVERSHKHVNRQHAYLDDAKAYGTEPTRTLAQPYKLTAFELDHGLDASHSLDRAKAWARVPEALAAQSVAPPSVHKLRDGRVETTYRLEPKGLILPEPAVAAAEHRLATEIYQASAVRTPRLWVTVPTEPPAAVKDASLLPFALRCAAGPHVSQTARVRVNDPSACWRVEAAQGKPLEIDLGAQCLIAAVSTQGRHPATRLYPYFDRITGELEGADHLPNYRPGVPYRGPWWTVRTERGRTERTERLLWTEAGVGDSSNWRVCNAYHEPQWVESFELLWRADGGRKWHSLGTFEGNRDEVTEVAHSFGNVNGGLRARYLRIVPRETHNGGGLRVGVYGTVIAPVASVLRGGVFGRHAKRLAARGGDAVDLVEYTMTQPGATSSIAARYARDGQGVTKYSYGYDPATSASRFRRRMDTWREVDEERTGTVALEQWSSDEEDETCASPLPSPPLVSMILPAFNEGASADEAEDLALALALSLSMSEQPADMAEVETTDTGTDAPEMAVQATKELTKKPMEEPTGEAAGEAVVEEASEADGWLEVREQHGPAALQTQPGQDSDAMERWTDAELQDVELPPMCILTI